MTKTAFNAWFALLLQRWPFDLAEGTTALDFYRSRLWARAHAFHGQWERSFGEAVETAVASNRFGRPSVDQLVASTASRAGPDPLAQPQGLHGQALLDYQNAFWATRKRPTTDDRRKAHDWFARTAPSIARCLEHHWPELRTTNGTVASATSLHPKDHTEDEERAAIQDDRPT